MTKYYSPDELGAQCDRNGTDITVTIDGHTTEFSGYRHTSEATAAVVGDRRVYWEAECGAVWISEQEYAA